MSPLLPGPLVFPLSLLPVSPSSSSHTISHTHASLVVLGLGLGRDADRRKKTGSRRRIVIKEHLVAEDRKRIFGGSASSWKGPESPSHTSHKHCHTTLSLSHIIFLSHYLCHTLSLGPGRDADRRKKTGSRRRIVIKEHLVAEDRKRIVAVSVSSCRGPGPRGPSPTWPQSEGCPREGREGWLLEEQDRKRRCKVDANNYGRLHLCW